MRGAIPPLPEYVFMAWCLLKHRDNFIFTIFFKILLFVLPLMLENKFHAHFY
jgi:hypothetical protein